MPKGFSDFQHVCGNGTGKTSNVAIFRTIDAGLSGLHIRGCGRSRKFDSEMKEVRVVLGCAVLGDSCKVIKI